MEVPSGGSEAFFSLAGWRQQACSGWPLAMTLSEFPIDTRTLIPSGIRSDPVHWNQQDVYIWLEWCTEQFALPPIDSQNFHMNGKALCLLSKSDFVERAPRAGDVLFNALQLLLQRSLQNARLAATHFNTAACFGFPRAAGGAREIHNSSQALLEENQYSQISPVPDEVDSTVILSPATSSEGQAASPTGPPGMTKSSTENSSSNALENTVSRTPSPPNPPPVPRYNNTAFPTSAKIVEGVQDLSQPQVNRTQNTQGEPTGDKMSVRLLWDFLQQLLNDPEQRYRYCIIWKDKAKGVFKITDSHRLARLWGMQKNHLNMNFDKMSRAMRYYYRVKILQKEPGERLCYRFLRAPTELRYCKQSSLLDRSSEKSGDTENSSAGIKEECLSPSLDND